MIMMMDKKKIVNQIMGDKPEGEETSPLKAIAQELLTCIECGDADGLVSCLSSLISHLNSEGKNE